MFTKVLEIILRLSCRVAQLQLCALSQKGRNIGLSSISGMAPSGKEKTSESWRLTASQSSCLCVRAFEATGEGHFRTLKKILFAFTQLTTSLLTYARRAKIFNIFRSDLKHTCAIINEPARCKYHQECDRNVRRVLEFASS